MSITSKKATKRIDSEFEQRIRETGVFCKNYSLTVAPHKRKVPDTFCFGKKHT